MSKPNWKHFNYLPNSLFMMKSYALAALVASIISESFASNWLYLIRWVFNVS